MKYVTFIFAIAFAISASAEELKSLIVGQTIHTREAKASEYDRASAASSHSEVTFKIDDHAEFRVGQIQLSGYLINSSQSTVTVYVIGQNSSLKLEVPETNDVKLRTDLPKAAAAASPPMYALDLPAKSQVKYTGLVDLGTLKYSGSPTVNLKWRFLFWTPPKPTGTIDFKMPFPGQAKLDPLKIEIQKFVSSGTSADGAVAPVVALAIASLRNVSLEPQIFCYKSSMNFSWDLRAADGKALKSPELAPKGIDESAPLSESMCSLLLPGKSIDLETAKVTFNQKHFNVQAGRLNFNDLREGSYQLHFQAQNAAATVDSTDRALVSKLIEKFKAPRPTLTIESGVPFVLP